MNENRKRRGLANSKILTAAAICSLLLGSGNVMATNSDSGTLGVQEQMQTMTVTVKVLDATGEPVIGANVIQKGTANGSITDFNGVAKLDVPRNATLLVSFVGYKTQEVKAGTSLLSVTLKEDSEILNEVVVVGYGTQKKENLTGAVASVDVSKTLEARPIADVGRGLQGTTPGLSVVVPSGEVGSDPTIKIRGQVASEQGSSAPLILLDNVEIPSINLVNPDDIESISVLKDAASASIYGAKAAFGVVLITTKKGAKSDKVNISYQNNFSWQNVAKDIEMGGIESLAYTIDYLKRVDSPYTGAFWMVGLDSYTKAQEWNKQWGGKIGKDDPLVYGRDWEVIDNKKYLYRNFDPYEYMVREWAPTQSHNLTVNGKSGKTTFNIGLGLLDQSGMNKNAKEDNFNRYNASVRLSTEFNKHITLRAGAIYSKRVKRYANVSTSTSADIWYYLYRWGSYTPLGMNEDGAMLRSPVSESAQANTAEISDNYTNINIGATINITDNWKVDVDYTHANNEKIENKPGIRYTAADTWSGATLVKDENGNQVYVDGAGNVVSAGTQGAIPKYALKTYEYTSTGSSSTDYMYRRHYNTERNTLNITTNYDWQINDDHNLKVLLGLNRVTYDSEYHWAKITQLLDLSNPNFDLTGGTQTSSGGIAWEGQFGYFGRLNYNFKEKYLLEANLRRDATSKFPENMRWRWYPSFSAGWRVSEEAFMDWAKPVLSTFKLRGSWGMIGDQTVASSLYIPTMSIGLNSWLAPGNKKLVGVGTPAAVYGAVTWQDIKTIDFGFDARFFNGDLGVTFDWYQRKTENMIMGAEGIAPTFGASAPKGNFGALKTTGWEVAVDYNHQFSNGLSVNAMFTLSDAVSEITEYGTATSINDWYSGKTYGEIWGFRTDRLYQKEDFVYDSNGNLATTYALNGKEVPKGTSGAKEVYKLSDPNGVYQDYLQSGSFMFGPGDVKYKDVDGDGKIDRGEQSVTKHGDLEVIGNSTPRYEWGLRLGANWKGFDASIFMQGVADREIWGNSSLTIPGFHISDGAMATAFTTDFWTENRTDAFYPRPWHMGNGNDALNMCKQDRYLLDMSYWRIKNITLGYTLPSNLTKKVWMNKARVYVALENFFTFDNLNGLPLDPEEVAGVSYFHSSNYNSGRTGVGAPTFKSLSFGVQLNF